jgi:hypothetical protein
MGTFEDGASHSEAPRETMTMSEAASLLGVSTLSVRRMCKAYEKSGGEAGLAFAWTSPLSDRRDVNGHELRGHRRPFADAVHDAARKIGRLGGEQGAQSSSDVHS